MAPLRVLLALSLVAAAAAQWWGGAAAPPPPPPPADGVLLRDVQALTFRRGAWTAGRRVRPRPQLVCVGSACAAHQLDVLQCRNRGVDDRGAVQWECRGDDVPRKYVMSTTDVVCEGYAHAGDAAALVGSCAVRYRLEYRDAVRAPSAAARGPTHGDVLGAFLVCAVVVVGLVVLVALARGGGAEAAAPPRFRSYGGGYYGGGGYGCGGYYGGGAAAWSAAASAHDAAVAAREARAAAREARASRGGGDGDEGGGGSGTRRPQTGFGTTTTL
jgi:hypothetical protein